MEPENHGFQKGLSFSRDLFLRFHVNFGDAINSDFCSERMGYQKKLQKPGTKSFHPRHFHHFHGNLIGCPPPLMPPTPRKQGPDKAWHHWIMKPTLKTTIAEALVSMSNVGATACQYEASFVGDRWMFFFCLGKISWGLFFGRIENSEEISIS